MEDRCWLNFQPVYWSLLQYIEHRITTYFSFGNHEMVETDEVYKVKLTLKAPITTAADDKF